MKFVLKTLTAALIALPLVPVTVDAATRHHSHRAAPAAVAPPHVDGFDVEQVRQLSPGTDLNFKLYGTPGAAATVGLDGSARRVALEEKQLGVYEGTYTVSTRDKLTPDSTVTANLRLGNQVATAVLDEPLLAGSTPSAQRAAAGAARIDSFEMAPARALTGGNELTFSARGTPGGQASVSIPGARKVLLQETRPGYYGGSYTIRNDDRIDTQSPLVARLRVGDQTAMTTLGRPLAAVSNTAAPMAQAPVPPHAHPQPHVQPQQTRAYYPQPLAQNDSWPAAQQRPAPVVCGNCATVVAVNPIQVNGAGSYVGPVAGGVVGALLGSQIGGGNGRTLGGVAGAVGGAFAGREIERRVGKTTHYEVVARLNNGGQQTFSYASDPGLAVGTRVRIEGDRLVRER